MARDAVFSTQTGASIQMHTGSVKDDELKVVGHDPTWVDRFEQIAMALRGALSGIDARVEHVGSTSVPGLVAKPVIDIDVVVNTADDMMAATERLEAIGYVPKGTRGIPEREAFDQPPTEPTHHLYVVERNSRPHRDHVLLRELLRKRPELRERYAAVKRQHAHLLKTDRLGYQGAKSDLIEELLALARAEVGLTDPTAEEHDGVVYRWRESLPDREVDELHGTDEHGRPFGWRRARPLSLGWVTARRGAHLVGFANVAWDGYRHAFLLDVAVAPRERRGGIGTRLVHRATDETRRAGCAWLHVDYEPHLAAFYSGCGFRDSAAGVLRL